MNTNRMQRAPRVVKQLAELGFTWRRILAGLLFVVVVGLPIWIAATAGIGPKHMNHDRWFGYAAALAGIYAFSVLIWAVHRLASRIVKRAQPEGSSYVAPPGLLVGADNRLSTSKLSAAAWTWVLAWAILALAVAKWAGNPDGWSKLLEQGLEDQYLILLGGPFLALVSAKAFLSSGLSTSSINKTVETDAGASSTASRISQAYSDDSGQTDLVDTQYLLFGSVVIVVFIGTFLRGPFNQGLPALPDFLIALASVGTTVYIANKWQASDAAPAVTRVVPDQQDIAALGPVTIYGTNLITVSQGGRPYQYKDDDEVQVIFDGVAAVSCTYKELTEERGKTSGPGSGSDWITVQPPAPPASAAWAANTLSADITFVNVFGVPSTTPMKFTYIRQE
jgi:hypothetical protein